MEQPLLLPQRLIELGVFVMPQAAPCDQVVRVLDDADRVDLQASELLGELDDAVGVGLQARPGEALLRDGETTCRL